MQTRHLFTHLPHTSFFRCDQHMWAYAQTQKQTLEHIHKSSQIPIRETFERVRLRRFDSTRARKGKQNHVTESRRRKIEFCIHIYISICFSIEIYM